MARYSSNLELNASSVKFFKALIPKSPKVKLAVTVALIKAFLSSSLVKSPSPFAKLAAIVPAKESPQPVGSTTWSVGYAGSEIM